MSEGTWRPVSPLVGPVPWPTRFPGLLLLYTLFYLGSSFLNLLLYLCPAFLNLLLHLLLHLVAYLLFYFPSARGQPEDRD